MLTGRKPRVPAPSTLARSLDTVLETVWWPQSLHAEQALSRVHDDCDGDLSQTLMVYLGRDLDVHVGMGHALETLRFREPMGGGMSPRVRNALLVLAEAIRRDNELIPRKAQSGESSPTPKD